MEPQLGRGITENTIQSRHDNGNPFATLTNQEEIKSELLKVSPVPGDPESMKPEVGRGISENTVQPRYDDGNTHSPLTNQVDMDSLLLQTMSVPDGHKSVEPGVGRGISENTIQPRYDDGTLTNQVDRNSVLQTMPAPGGHNSMAHEVGRGALENAVQPTYNYGNTHTTLNNQVDINELLQIPPAPGDATPIPIVANQAETVPSAEIPSSGGPPSGSNSANDYDIGMLPNHEGYHVQSVSPEPVLSTIDFPTEASGWSVISESPNSGISETLPSVETLPSGISESLPSGPGYSIHEYMAQADVDWRNLNSSPSSNQPIQNMVYQDGYDPNRIPASVFDRNPASPMDWSNASNESLFSIYVGNSFSGYQGMFQSGEFGKIEQLNKQQNPSENLEPKVKANEESNFSPGLPTLPETSIEHKTQQSANIKDDIIIHEGLTKRSITTIEESKENHGDIDMHEGLSKRLTATTEETKENHENKTFHEENLAADSLSSHEGGLSHLETTNSFQNRLSNDSAKSGSSKHRLSIESCGSFAFPVLVTDLGKSSSFRIGSDNREEQQLKQNHHQHHHQQQQQEVKQQSESPKTTTTHAAARNRGCLSWFSGWLRCW